MKHAFLIMAYNNWNQLKTLIQCLDDSRSSIYVHIDKKSADFQKNSFIGGGIVTNAKLTFIERQPLYWGTLSEVECELSLMKAAVEDGFDYCHLLSGQDLPLKPFDKIDEFFCQNEGKNFIEFNPEWYDLTGKNEPMCSGSYKINYYHPLVKCKNYRKYKAIKYGDHLIAHLQKWFGLKRHKGWDIYAGSQFFSATFEFASYIVNNIDNIKKNYNCTLASSEVFMQTTIMQSPFKDTVYSMEKEKGNLRYIDWSRREGTGPRTFRLEDYDSIVNKPEGVLFGRKFNESIDREIIKKIVEYVRQ